MKKLNLDVFNQEGCFKDEGYVEVRATSGVLELPIFIIQNSHKPKIVFTGAMHSCEYCGTIALIKLVSDLRLTEPDQINGCIVVIPVANVKGFPMKAFCTSQYDGSNLSRSYPGDPDGSDSERLAYVIWKIVQSADYYVDLHGGDISETIVAPFSIIHDSADENRNQTSFRLATHFGVRYVFRTTTEKNEYGWSDHKSLYGLASDHGIASVIAEAGGCGLADSNSVEFLYRGVKRILKSLNVAPTEILSSNEQPIEEKSILFTRSMAVVKPHNRGIFRNFVLKEEIVEQGQKIGEIRDYLGDLIETIRSPISGVPVLMHSASGVSYEDILYFMIGTK